MPSIDLSKLNSTPEFDYVFLKNALRDYRHPRVKINQLLSTGRLTRVKKGIYISSEGGYSPPVLANMIYGPSYVSLEYALSFYGLIPERVMTVTSMTLGRRKTFNTPIGTFSYEPLDAKYYPLGLRYEKLDLDRGFLIAGPEKALIDRTLRVKDITTAQDMSDYLEHDIRFNFYVTGVISLGKMRQLAKAYDKPIVWLLEEALRSRMGNK